MPTVGEFERELLAIQPDLRRWAKKLTHGEDQVDDLVSHTNIKMIENRNRFEPGTSMKAWGFVIARNLFLTQMRRQRWNGGSIDDLAVDLLPSIHAAQPLVIELQETIEQVERLRPEFRDALLLVGSGASYEEAAEELCCSVGTVKSRVGRARAALAEAMA